MSSTSEELIHYGIKGMKWGVRRNTTTSKTTRKKKPNKNPRNKNYTGKDRAQDRRKLGNGSVRRINKRMNKGQDLKTARKNETKFRKNRNRAITLTAVSVKYRREIQMGLRVTSSLLAMGAEVAAQSVAKRAQTKRGQAASANSMGIPRQGSGINYGKKNRKGVYNISSL